MAKLLSINCLLLGTLIIQPVHASATGGWSATAVTDTTKTSTERSNKIEESTDNEKDKPIVAGSAETIEISNIPAGETVSVYNIVGQIEATTIMEEGITRISVQKGTYIVKWKKFAEKVSVAN